MFHKFTPVSPVEMPCLFIRAGLMSTLDAHAIVQGAMSPMERAREIAC